MSFTSEQIQFLENCKNRFENTNDKEELVNQLMCFIQALREIFTDNIFETRLSQLLNPLLFDSKLNKPKVLDVMDNAVRYYKETLQIQYKAL
ncbi:hypothetical protein SD427_13855 [Chryseobacterium sp. JJR-5R]|uniref:hypothetical protein n=1 Tax=Chryseobacterium sp. JJR-5R TaxID=3093923 RepID=UPI002A74F572|nr:hypothetical protein [Chryseobacterium sp. JJR-5R]WPO81849.1 hypothetical protein SD427_13855 [Chryseobacterium sp. JJR-5R]